MLAAWLSLAPSALRADPTDPAGAPASETGLVREVLDAWGIDSELESVSRYALASLEDGRAQVAPGDRAELAQLVRTAFHPETLRAVVLDELLTRFDAALARRALDQLREPGSRAVLSRLGEAAHGSACLRETSLETLRPAITEERDTLLRVVAEGLGPTARSRALAAQVFRAMLEASNQALPPERRFTPEERSLLLASQRAAIARALPTDFRALHCVFREVETETLRGVVRVLDSDPGRWFLETRRAALESALLLASDAAARWIVEHFDPSEPRRRALQTAKLPSP